MIDGSYRDKQRSRELAAAHYAPILAALEGVPVDTVADTPLRELIASAKSRCEFMMKPWTCENGYHDEASLGSEFRSNWPNGLQGTVHYFECRICGKRSSGGRFA